MGQWVFQQKKFKKPEKLNLVPIMDAIFIFIFFLLSSAQLVDVYEINISTPIKKEIINQSDDRNFNLVVIPNEESLEIEFGLKEITKKKFKYLQRGEIIAFLMDLKKSNPTENTIRIRTSPEVKFKKAIEAIDLTQDPKLNNKLFTQIVFEQEKNNEEISNK
jgi:biopolymer transport protein ExbD